MTPSLSQSGNALFYILLCIALFAALGYAFSKSNVGTNSVKSEKSKLMASEIINYSNQIADTVTKLKLRGCKDTEISFENTVVTGYINPNSPSSGDKRCWVFDAAGGGMTWRDFTESYASATSYLVGNGTQQLEWVGSPLLSDLYMRIPFNKAGGDINGVCDIINSQFGLDADDKSTATWEPSIDGSWTSGKFVGTFYDGGITIKPGTGGTVNVGGLKYSKTFCYGHNTGLVSFVKVLITR